MLPGGEVGLLVGGCAGEPEHNFVEVLLVHSHRHFVDGGHIDRLHHGIGCHVAEQSYLAACLGCYVVLGPEHQYVGLYSKLLKFLHRVLCRFCFQFLGCGYVGHVCEVDAEAVASELPAQLPYGFQERERFDVAHHTADFGDYEVVFSGFAQMLHTVLDLVGDVGHNLHGFAQIVAAPFLVDDALVDASGGEVVGACGLDVGEPFVVAEVEVGFMTIDCHIAFAVLIGVERARINVDVGVEFLYCDPESACY